MRRLRCTNGRAAIAAFLGLGGAAATMFPACLPPQSSYCVQDLSNSPRVDGVDYVTCENQLCVETRVGTDPDANGATTAQCVPIPTACEDGGGCVMIEGVAGATPACTTALAGMCPGNAGPVTLCYQDNWIVCDGNP